MYCAENGIPCKPFDPDAIAVLTERPWPGNVRELKNTIERLEILAPGESISAADVEALSGPRAMAGPGGTADLIERHSSFTDYRDAAEKAFLLAKLDEHDWNVSETARRLGMQRSHLYKKIEKHGLSRD